ncbi:MAG: chlorite dismutase family protein [Planctomycetota bacterium]|nr:MAG: chlorite dismutase family protein [Planctomycetota bacterium]
MVEIYGQEVPQTLEGWYLLHDVYAVNWSRWRAEEPATREEIANQTARWLTSAAGYEKGDSAAYSVLTQKGDLMFLHYRESPDELNYLELSLRQTRLYEFLIPSFSFLSVIEINMYELATLARMKLADQDIIPGSVEYDSAFETEMAKQKSRVQSRLFGDIPEQRYICFYPMNKRRGVKLNWYTLSVAERHDIMRSQGRIIRKYQEQVAEVVSGAIGLDAWEYAVSLYSDDVLTIKRMLYELHFDPAIAVYTNFGPTYVGIRYQPGQLTDLLVGKLK